MKRSIFQIVGLLLLLPLFSGCNDSDDVAAIFTGKTWKLNYITVDGGHEMFGFWENEEQEKASIKELNKNGTYNIVFDGTEGLNAATSYEGDSNNLYLLYKPASGKQTFRMVFRVVSSK